MKDDLEMLIPGDQFRGILQSLREGVQIINFDWEYVYVNDALVIMSQYSREELIGYTMMEKYPGIEKTQLFMAMKACMETRSPQHIDNEFIFPNGSSAHFELSIQPIPEGIFVLSIDTTEKNRDKENLFKANRLYAYLSAVNQSIVHVRSEQELMDKTCSIAVEVGGFRSARIDVIDRLKGELNMVSMSAAPEIVEMVLKTASIALEDPQLEGTLRGRVLDTGEHAVSNDLLEGSASRFWKQTLKAQGIRSAISLPLKRGGQIIAIFSMQAVAKDFFDDAEIALLKEAAGDISFALDNFEKEKRHKETEALVIRNEKRFRSLIEKSSDIKALFSPDGDVFYVSPSVTKFLGYAPEEFTALSVDELVHPDDIPALEEEMAAILPVPGASFVYEHRVLDNRNNWVWCESTITNQLQEPAIQAMVTNFKDISEKKLTDEQRTFDRNNLYALINNTKDLMWSIDTDFNLITSNIPFDETIHASGKKIEKGGSILSGAFSEAQSNRFRQYYDRAFTGESFTEIEHGEYPEEYWLEISFCPIRRDDEVIGMACHSRDITNRIKREQSLQKIFREISDYKYALDESSIVAITDQKGIITHVNDNFCKISKYSREELIGQDHRIINSGYHSSVFIRSLWTTIAKGETWRGEIRNKAKDGSIYWVDTTIVPFLNDQQKPYQYIGIRADITQRKKMEENLQKSEKSLKEAQAIAHMGNWRMDYLTNIFTWSEEACRIYGLTSGENMHTYDAWLDFVHPDDLQSVIEANDEARKTLGDNVLNYRIVLKNGDVKHIYLKSKFEFDSAGQPVGLYGIAHDITEIKEVEEQFRRSEAFNRGVLNSLSSHIAVIDRFGDIIAVNQAWERFSEENGETTLQRAGKGTNYFHICEASSSQGDEIAKVVLEGMREVMAEEIPLFYLEYPCHSPHEERWFAMRVMKFYSDDPMIVISHENITELKKVQEERDDALQVLENRVEERTKELVEKNLNILDSINYAKRIQLGLLNPKSQLYEIFPNSFILSKPRDIVSGDFFWCHHRRNKKFIVVADCTGHGVPGALMSIIGNNLLNQIIVDEHIENPSEVLELLDQRLKETVKSDVEEVKDGMDLALCVIDTHFNELYYAGAYRPLFISNGHRGIKELAPDRTSLGGGMQEGSKKFETTRFPIVPGECIYLCSDGYYSQFGGPRQKKFMKSRFLDTLESLKGKPMQEQKKVLQETLENWMGHTDQVDDIMVVGIEL